MSKYIDRFCLSKEIKKFDGYTIYRGYDRSNHEEIFVKIYSFNKLEEDLFFHKNVVNEMTINEELDSSIILKPISYLRTLNNMYHVYPYISLGSLKNFMQKNSEEKIVSCGRSLCL